MYKCNDRNLNRKPSFVFKRSRAQLELLVKMDQENVGVQSSSYVFVDAKADRCKGFKTVTLWLYHPLLKQIVKLATFESENKGKLSDFRELKNKALVEFHGFEFNPYEIMSDEGGAIWSSLEEVFVDLFLHRVVSCKAHFKFAVDRKCLELPSNVKAKFKLLCNDISKAGTALMYAKPRRIWKTFVIKMLFLYQHGLSGGMIANL